MKSPFLGIGVSFAIGILAQHFGIDLAPGYPLGVLGGCIVLWLLRKTRCFLPVLLGLVVLMGAFRFHSGSLRPEKAVENEISKYRVEIEGKVAGQPELKKRGRRIMASFILDAQKVRKGPRTRKRTKEVAGGVQVFWIQPGFAPEAGDTVAVFGKLEKPRSVLNPGEFDHAKYLARKNIFAVMQPIGRGSGRLVEKASPRSLKLWVGRARVGLSGLIERLYPVPQAAVLKALVLGIRSDVGPKIQSTFMKTGTVHLLAISGLNITMIAGSFFFIFLMAGVPRKWTAFLTLGVVVFYVPLAGAGIPVQRAALMAAIVLIAVLIGRPAQLLNALFASFFLLLWAEPKSLWDVGFQLSFLSVLSLAVVLPILPRHGLFSLSVGGSLAVLAGTSPVVLYYFNTFSPVGVIANLVAIPVFDAALLSTLFAMAFFWVPLIGSALLAVSSGLVTAGLAWIGWLAEWRWGYWFLLKPAAWQLWSYYGSLALILFTAGQRFPMRRFVLGVCVLFWAIAAFSMLRMDTQNSFRLTALASGREPILHVRFSSGADWLVNTGRSFPSDQGERLVLPYLRQRGIKEMEGILLTDLYKKHCGGMHAILRDVKVRRVLLPGGAVIPGDLEKSIRTAGGKAEFLKAGQKIRLGDETVTVLSLQKRGMALLIEASPGKILFVSDPVLLDSKTVEQAAPDVVILPFLKNPVSPETLETLLKKPVKWIFPGNEAAAFLRKNGSGDEYFDLTKSGAIAISSVGRQISVNFLKDAVV